MSHRRNITSSRREDSRRRRAYILIAVLGIATVAASVGVAYLEANSTSMPEADNRFYKMRAKYLAESGAELAKHYLLYPPTTVALGSYWTGGSNIAIDTTSDSTSVTVTPHATQKDRYKIVSGGIAKDFTGAVRGKKSVTADVVVPPVNKWSFTQAMVAAGSVSVPSQVRISGDLHSNGSAAAPLLTGGYCNGTVSSSGTTLWLGSGSPTVKSLQPAISLPKALVSSYQTYKVRGKTYTAYAWASDKITAADATTLNAIDMSSTNPGRIIAVESGNFTLKNGAQINGTLLVDSRLEFEVNTQVTAETGFPALVVIGDIRSGAAAGSLTVTGPVIVGGDIQDNNNNNTAINVTGTTILRGGFDFKKSSSQLNISTNSDRNWFYDFESAATRQPITVVKWTED